MEYVAGFVFSADRKNVVLIKKEKPVWQAGHLNGVGGKVEPIDRKTRMNYHNAMSREFKEEAGVRVKPSRWREFCILRGDFGVVHFFELTDQRVFNKSKTMESEQIFKVPLEILSMIKVIPNLRWLIPMAITKTEIVVADVTVASDPTDEKG